MAQFLQNNMLWLIPIVSITFTIIMKISAKPNFMTIGYIDYLDFGFDLSISSVIALLTGIKDITGAWLLFFAFMLIMITSIFVNRAGWNKDTKQLRLRGVIIPDLVGVFLLIMVSLYMGGAIK